MLLNLIGYRTGADCSQMTCPRSKSWSESSGTWNHADEAECSDAGLCNRETGACECFDGYEGSACQRTSCPNDCSGHGQCRSNEVRLCRQGFCFARSAKTYLRLMITQDFALDFSEAVSTQQENIVAHGEHYYDFFRAQYAGAWDSGKHYGSVRMLC